jgi:uncharacterized protein (DUF849 family)
VLKVCLNGGVRRDEHPAVPVTAAELTADVTRCVAAGANAVHLHPRDRGEHETLDPEWVATAVSAVRRARPELPVGVSTGEWIEPDPDTRVAAVRAWSVLPDFASVNVHEHGAERVAVALHQRGVAVEAGIWTPEAVAAYLRWRVPVERILLECMRPDPADALTDAAQMLGSLPAGGPAVLLHAEGPAVWPVLREAVRRGLHTRVGLEDTRALPDGSVAAGNAELVAVAVALGAR